MILFYLFHILSIFFNTFRVRRSVFKSLAEAVRESEIANADPANVIVHATRQR